MDSCWISICLVEVLQGRGLPQFAQYARMSPLFAPQYGQNFVVRVASPAGGGGEGAHPTGGIVGCATVLPLARSRPARPMMSSIGPKMSAPMQMNGRPGIRRLTTPARVKTTPRSTRRTFKLSLMVIMDRQADEPFSGLSLVCRVLGLVSAFPLRPDRHLVQEGRKTVHVP